MASNINIQKKCEWCGKLFIAHKISTRCCSRRCANLAYKEKTRQKRVSEFQTMVNQQIEKEDCIDKDFFTPSEAAKYIGISRATFYRYLETNLIKSVQLKRKTIIRKRDIEALFDNASPYKKHLPKSKQSITDFYTTAEVKEKYGVKDSWIFHIAKEHNIPRTFHCGKTYWSKKHIDDYFAKKAPDPEIKEWYSTQDMQEKFFFCIKECHSQKENRNHGVLLQKACRHCQRPHSSRRAQILHHCRSDGTIQTDTGSTLPLCKIP